jgi:hypothetical protein
VLARSANCGSLVLVLGDIDTDVRRQRDGSNMAIKVRLAHLLVDAIVNGSLFEAEPLAQSLD